MLRQASRIEKGFDSSIKQFYAALRRYLSVGPEDSIGRAQTDGDSRSRCRPRVGHGLTELAFCEIDGLVAIR